jgi:2-polyprenyl-3-methyl-5-hydroxy-6-metoxy-1,4-benzoquinol methylase
MSKALKPPCPICGNNEQTKIHAIEQCSKVFRIQCEDCKTIFFDRQPPYEPKYDRKYNAHFYRPGDIRKAGIMAATIAEIAITKYIGPCILEAGTGNGLTAFLLNEMGIHTEAVEIDLDVAGYITRKYGYAVYATRFETWKTETEWALIYSSHVIEHTDDPKGFLKKAIDILSPGGTLFLETPDVAYNTKYSERWHHFKTRDPYEHKILFGQPGLYMLLSNLGYVNIRMATVPEYQILRIQAEKPKEG